MNKPKIYIDGQAGTTGLEIAKRLSNREDIELLKIPDDKRIRKSSIHQSPRSLEIYSTGDIPKYFLKASVKYLGELYPTISAIS